MSFTVTSAPTAGTLSSTAGTTLCGGNTTTVSATGTTGGSWSSDNSSVLSIDATGNATAGTAGAATIKYVVSNTCGADSATLAFTVTAAPNAGTISGAASVCGTASSTLASTGDAGGVWSSDNSSVATVDASTGSVTGVTDGTANIQYKVTNTCGADSVSVSFTVTSVPTAGTLSSTAGTTLCPGNTTTVSATGTTGGTWSSDNSTVLSIDATGIATAGTAGAATIKYVVSNTCGADSATLAFTVNPAPVAGTITGTASVCGTASSTLASTGDAGGVWSSDNSAVATVDASTGSVTGVATGTANIQYKVTNSCGDDSVSVSFSVVLPPVAGTLSSSAGTNLCVGNSSTISTTGDLGGIWSSDDIAVATVDASTGALSTLTAGAITIKYLVTNACGADSATTGITVNALPVAGTISGVDTVCNGASATMSVTASGGTWAMSNANASITSGGDVTGLAVGLDTVYYIVTSTFCGADTARHPVYVNAVLTAGTVTGADSVCNGASTALTTTGDAGGTWASSDGSIVTVDATGNVTGLTTGTATISYTVANTCGTNTATHDVVVNPLPIAGTVSATSDSMCVGASVTVSTTSTGGVWSMSNSNATVDASGNVTGVTGGVDTAMYIVSTFSCGADTSRYALKVIAAPTAGTITGASYVCVSSTITLTPSVSGGTWVSTDPFYATVDASTGVVTGNSVGIVDVYYRVSNMCGADSVFQTLNVTTGADPGTISGPTSVCFGGTLTLSETVSGGTWSSSDASIASVDASGVVYGIAPGAATISYSVTLSGCTPASATYDVTILGLPVMSPISGTATVCAGTSVSYSDTATTGTWISSNTSVVTVNAATGAGTALTTGTILITYQETNSCGTSDSTFSQTVITVPSMASITGSNTVCVGASTTLSDATTGGSWSSTSSNVSVVAATGAVTGVATGSATITYQMTNTCGTTDSTFAMTVNDVPLATPISGASGVCVGTSTTLTNSTSGGAWASSDLSRATIDASGNVNGIAVGSLTISYTVTNACGPTVILKPMTVDLAPSAGSIVGTTPLCLASTETLTNTTTGGTWLSGNLGVATIDPSTGAVTPVSTGTVTMSYHVTTGCGTADSIFNLTIIDVPVVDPSFGGLPFVCAGATTTVTNDSLGGTWSSGDLTVATVEPTTGIIHGLTKGPGYVYITYTITNSCGPTFQVDPVTVDSIPVVAAISGATSVCPTLTTTLTDATPGGTWSNVYTSIATISGAGVVTGVTSGVDTVIYNVTNSCGSTDARMEFTVSPLPVAGAITGTPTVCRTAVTTLSNATAIPTGTWTSANPSIATVDASTGDVTGVAIGSVLISYTVSTVCASVVDTQRVTVNDVPVVAPISGLTYVCMAGTTTLLDPTPGGTWSSSNTSLATVDAGGIVYPVALGNVTISYTVTNGCGPTSSTYSVDVMTLPVVAPIVGITEICPGTASALSDDSTGGVWSTSDATIASVNTTGTLFGIGAGAATISYAVTNVCGVTTVNTPVTIDPLPNAGAISGATSVCIGSSTSLTETVTGGVWSTSDASIASIDATGLVSGIAGGTVTVSYTDTNSCGSTYTTASMTVNLYPAMASITGTDSVCVGGTTTLSDATTGGTWSSSNIGLATVDATGTVYGIITGTVTITYEMVNGCGATDSLFTMRVVGPPTVAAVTGYSGPICIGANDTLYNVTPGGIWTSINPPVADIDGVTGIVTGFTADTVTMLYTVSNACGSTAATQLVAVDAAPSAGVLSGTSPICVGSSTTYVSTIPGGTWSVSNTVNATVDVAGNVTGAVRGADTLYYAVSTTCATDIVSTVVAVDDVPVLASIAGPTSVCVGATITLTNDTTGGTWTSGSTTNATVVAGTGVVTGVAGGSVSISYSLTNACGTTDSTYSITVIDLPVNSSVTGIDSVCAGNVTTLTDASVGGTWISSDNTIATVDAAGNVYGVSRGSVVITYEMSNTCATIDSVMNFTVLDVPIVASITGASTVCVGTSATQSDATPGGVWSLSNYSTATIDAAGVVTGLATGTDTVYYSVTGTCGVTSPFAVITVVDIPVLSSVSATATAICIGSTTTVSDTATGGTWSSSDATIATVDGSGVVTGVGTGVVNITYTVTAACGSFDSTIAITVNTLPVVGPITGVSSFCAGTMTSLTDTTVGGTWSSSSTAVATVDASGVVTGVAGGTAYISYSVTNMCGTTVSRLPITVNSLPGAGTITGATSVCIGATATVVDAVSGGSWSSSNPSVATVDASGNVLGITNGTVTLTYTVTTGAGCSSGVTASFTVNPIPVLSPISGPSAVAAGSTITLTDTAVGGTWTSLYTSIATVSGAGVVRGVSIGVDTIVYTVTNSFGCSASAIKPIYVSGSLSTSYIFPSAGATWCHHEPVPMFVFTPDTTNLFVYQWYRDGIAIPGATDSAYNADTSGFFTCSITNAGGTVTLTGITVNPEPNPVIGVTFGRTFYTGTYATYQWYFNGTAVSGATTDSLVEIGNGIYSVVVTDIHGCQDTSAAYVDSTYAVENVGQIGVKIYPNPASTFIYIDAPARVNVEIMSADGKLVIRKENAKSIDISEISTGMYMIMVYDMYNNLVKADKIMKVE